LGWGAHVRWRSLNLDGKVRIKIRKGFITAGKKMTQTDRAAGGEMQVLSTEKGNKFSCQKGGKSLRGSLQLNSIRKRKKDGRKGPVRKTKKNLHSGKSLLNRRNLGLPYRSVRCLRNHREESQRIWGGRSRWINK